MGKKEYYDYFNHYPIPPYYIHLYVQCQSCGFYLWQNSMVLTMCPRCALNLQIFELEISFGKSSSEKYNKAVKLAKSINGYTEKEINSRIVHIVRFNNLDEYNMELIEKSNVLKRLILITFKWVSFNITLNGSIISVEALNGIEYELNRIHLHIK